MQSNNQSAIPWPEDYAVLEEKLLAELGGDSRIYIHRTISEGKSGACVMVADVISQKFTGQAILKLDRAVGSKSLEAMEFERHKHAIETAPDYAEQYLPKLVCAVQHENEVAALTTIAARGLEYAVAWAACSYGPQREMALRLSDDLLERWNANYSLDPEMLTPQDLLDSWLDYRIDRDRGGRIHDFLSTKCTLPPDTPAFAYDGHWFPNPLVFANRGVPLQETARLRAVRGNQHGDLHGKNVLVTKQSEQELRYYLIDLDFYRDDGFLFYDHGIFELDYLLTSRERIRPQNWKTLLGNLTRIPPREQAAGLVGEDIGILQLVLQFRDRPKAWVDRHQPNRLSFLDSQYLLARLAAGLAITHQRREDAIRAMAFLYAAHNLKDYLALHEFEWPKHGPEFGLDALFNGEPVASASSKAAPDFAEPQTHEQTDVQVPRPPKRAVAVLPLAGLNDQLSGENVTENLTDRIIAQLSRTDWFTTIGRSATSAYRDRDPDPQQVGKQLHAHYVLLGTARQSGSEVQTAVRLVQTESGEEVWSDRYRINMDTDDVVAAEDKIAYAVASRVDAQLAQSERARAMRKPPENLDSWDMFMRARWHFFQYTSEDDVIARKLCLDAIEMAPSFSDPHALLAQMEIRSIFFEWAEPGADIFANAVKHGRQAITLDPGSSFAHESLSRSYLFEGRTAIAVAEAETAITLNPTSAGAHWNLAMALVWAGKPAEAIPVIDISMRLDPFDQGLAYKLCVKAAALMLLGRLQKAEGLARQAMDVSHGHMIGLLTLAITLSRQGRMEEAQEAVRQAVLRRPDLSADNIKNMLSGLKPEVRNFLITRFVDLGIPQ
ncbi:MAG: hypothetical protein GY789_03840 [Hyphomicrobiales bacterium]|nr:hypothetical protein [Hyphomicrobiales bacterium]MCP4997276.1 hypothetical protein [Hyphomicrobiales bacterium]